MKKATLLATAVLLAVFGAGIFAGIFIDRHFPRPTGGVFTINPGHPVAMEEIRKVLELDDQQAAHIQAILSERQRTVERMWETLRPEVEKTVLEVHNEIASLLRPDQLQLLHRWLRNRQAQQQVIPPAPPSR